MFKKIKTITKTILLLFLVIGLTSANVLAFEGPSKNNEKVNVLIGFHQAPGSLEKDMVTGYGGEIYKEFTMVNVIAARMSSRAVDALSKNPKIRYIEPDAPVYALNQTVPWGIDRVFGDESYSFDTWDITKGNGIEVAIIDTGIDKNHQDLVVLGGTNTIDGTDWGFDGSGHGTHVAGTVAALDNNLGVVGVGPEIGLYAVKVLDSSGSGTWSSVAAGIEWAVSQNIPVLNMSLGGGDSQTMRDVCNMAYSKGHLLVAAAGNSGNASGRGNNVGYPAAYDSVIAVAASDNNNKRASFSSTGPAVELIAPGVNVLSTLPGNSYGSYNGTSMASPHVAGVAALTWASNSGLTNVEIREALRQTAQDLGLSLNHQGYGLIRGDLAVRAVAEIEPPTTYTITSTAGMGGTINPFGEVEVYEGNSQTFEIIPNNGYVISDLLVDNVSVGAVSSYTFENVTSNHTIYALFEPVPVYNLSGNVTDNNNNPLEGAVVTIEETELSAVTGEDGKYEIMGVEEGVYNITAGKEGYGSNTKSIIIENDTTVNFILEEVEESAVPVINKFELTNTGNPAWSRVNIEWAVSSDTGLSSVKTEMVLNGTIVDSTTSFISGLSSNGTHELRNRNGKGNTYQIVITVTDTENRSTSKTKDIAL